MAVGSALKRGRLFGYIGSMEWMSSPRDPAGFENVELKGDCDLYSAPGFAKAMLARIGEGAGRLRLDLSGVDYLDSTGVGALIRILQEAKKRGCELRFAGIAGSPRKVLKMSNILALMKEEPKP
jgi:anti-sigma B factor antagonist